MKDTIQHLNQRVNNAEEDILRFFREIVAIPSMDSDIEEVGKRIGEEMRKLNYDKVYVDKYGSIVGKIGNGPKTLLYDTHIDTVGIGCAAFHDWEGVHPDFVVIGEPTNMKVYRGHKGRIEMEITSKGKSAHAASNYMGDNAIYKMLPVIQAISKMEKEFEPHEFLGQGRVTVTRVSSISPSTNAVPDECTIFIDRRVTFGETKEYWRSALEAIIPEAHKKDFEIRKLIYTEPSHTGAVYEYEQYFPAWALEEDHPFVQAGVETMKALWNSDDPFGQGKWDFSTNGNYWCGKAGIPSIGFGPGDEIYAHAVNEHVPLKDVVEATKFYALLPEMLRRAG